MSTPVDPSYTWNGDELDLDAYLARIGYAGERTPTSDTLRALVHAHTTSLPFENLEILLGRGVPLDVPTLQDKMIRRRRGGYCYENVALFAAALERLGFEFTGLAGRVSMGSKGLRPATHALVLVTVGDERLLCDVGFGAGPLAPVPLVHSPREFALGAWRYRLERGTGPLGGELWTLYQFGREGWVDRHSFTLNPQYRIDSAVGNHFVSTSPRSPFTARPFVQRFTPEQHEVLDGLMWTTEFPDGGGTGREIDLAELPKVLLEVFDIELDAPDIATLLRGNWITPQE